MNVFVICTRVSLVLVLGVMLVVLEEGSPREALAAPNANIDQVDGHIICDDKPGTFQYQFAGYPTDPYPDPPDMFGSCPSSPTQHHFSVWVRYDITAGYDYWFGIWDWSRGVWVASNFIDNAWSSCECTWLATWSPYFKSNCSSNADFTTCADSYSVYSYWRQQSGGSWYTYDWVHGLVNGDWDWASADDPEHFHWSPNGYQRPIKDAPFTQGGKSWVYVTSRAAYYDHISNEGTERLNRLNNWAGSLQWEFRRNADGWDAGQIFGCSIWSVYTYYTNIPGFEVTTNQIEENEACGGDEEAQGKTSTLSALSAYYLGDASGANNTYWYYKQLFLRKSANQGQWFRLQTEFELNEYDSYPVPIWGDTKFDIVIPTQRDEWF